MIKTELCTKRSNKEIVADEGRKVSRVGLMKMLAICEAKAIEKAIEECKINCQVNGEVVLISDLKKYADNLRGEYEGVNFDCVYAICFRVQ